MRITIVASNIKGGGGKELLDYLLEYLENKYSHIELLVYVDITSQNIQSYKNRTVIHLVSNIEKIKLFCQPLKNALYFGNLPPLVKSKHSVVYLHNQYLLMPTNQLLKYSFKFFIKYGLQQIYINHFIKNVDLVACQNDEVKNKFINKYKFNNVESLPFFRLCSINLNKEYSKIYDFCYVSLSYPHKNHITLLNAFEMLSNENISISLALTVQEGNDEILKKINIINEKGIVKIHNFGLLSKDNVCRLYAQSRCMVFPSKLESFGLPLVESVKMGLDVIAADLDYVHKVIKPSLVFDPNDTNDIAKKMKMYMNGNIKKSETIIDNKIDDLIKILIKEKNV